MAHTRTSLLLSLVLLARTAASAAGLPLDTSAAPIAVSGVYSVTFHLNLAPRLCQPGSILDLPGAHGADSQEVLTCGIEQLGATPVAAGQASVTGSTATCAAEIPFSWTVTSPPGGVALFYRDRRGEPPGSRVQHCSDQAPAADQRRFSRRRRQRQSHSEPDLLSANRAVLAPPVYSRAARCVILSLSP